MKENLRDICESWQHQQFEGFFISRCMFHISCLRLVDVVVYWSFGGMLPCVATNAPPHPHAHPSHVYYTSVLGS